MAVKKEVVAPATETDYTQAVLKIADANNLIKEKTNRVAELEEKEAIVASELKRNEVSRDEVAQEVQKLVNKLETLKKNVAEVEAHENADISARSAEVSARELAVKEREDALQDLNISIERSRAEAETIIEENRKAQADVDSKLSEAQHLSDARKSEIAELKAAKEEAERAASKLEVQRGEVAAASAEYTALLSKVKESEENARALHDSIQKDREDAQKKINEARTENASAEYNKGLATQLTASFRQALHTYVQLNGTEIKIPELTNEMKEWIAKDLIKQISE